MKLNQVANLLHIMNILYLLIYFLVYFLLPFLEQQSGTFIRCYAGNYFFPQMKQWK